MAWKMAPRIIIRNFMKQYVVMVTKQDRKFRVTAIYEKKYSHGGDLFKIDESRTRELIREMNLKSAFSRSKIARKARTSMY